jgi:hypothetical protein
MDCLKIVGSTLMISALRTVSMAFGTELSKNYQCSTSSNVAAQMAISLFAPETRDDIGELLLLQFTLS